jgi:hypothetical protein
METIFERILHQPPVIPDAIVAPALREIVSQPPIYQVENFLVSRKEYMRTTQVECVPLSNKTPTVSADYRVTLQYLALMTAALAGNHQPH